MRGSVAALRFAAAGVLLLAGCAQIVRPPESASTPAQTIARPVYEVVQGRDAALVARLRAAPPQPPQVSAGATVEGDEKLQRARGLVRIGVGHFPAGDAHAAREQAVAQAGAVGADQALVYPPAAADGIWMAEFYVRLQLPFGANFRDLTDAERQELGHGVQIGEVVGATPAAEANLLEGDYILKFNRQPVSDRAAFQAMLQKHMGQRVVLTVRRHGTTMNRLVVLGKLPGAPQ